MIARSEHALFSNSPTPLVGTALSFNEFFAGDSRLVTNQLNSCYPIGVILESISSLKKT